MESAQALAVVRSLANGVDPESGEIFPPESTSTPTFVLEAPVPPPTPVTTTSPPPEFTTAPAPLTRTP